MNVMNEMNKIKKGLGLLGIAGLCLLVLNVIFSLTYTCPEKQKLNDFEATLKSKALLLKSFEEGEGRNTPERVLSDIETFKNKYLKKKDLNSITKDLIKTANRNSLKVEKSDYSGKPQIEEGVKKYKITFPVKGKYSNVKKFLSQIQNKDYMVIVDNFDLKKDKNRKIDVNLTLSVYLI